MPANILNLPTYIVTRIEETDHDYHVYAQVKDAPRACGQCGSTQVVGFGRREQMIRDLPMHGKRVGIYVDTRRYRCRSCGRTFYELLPEVDEKRLMTRRLVKWIGQQSIKRTFASVAEETGVTDTTVKSVFQDYINELESQIRFETPKWMGIDEIHLIRPRCVVANIQNNTVVDILKDRNKKTVATYLFKLDGRDQVRYVAMDMWNPYRDAVREVLPQAQIVVDKFHVQRMANDALEKARKSMRESLTPKQRRGLVHDRFVLLKRERELTAKDRFLLDGWVKNYPVLGEAYRLKEAFFGIWDSQTPWDAQNAYQTWANSIPEELVSFYQPILTAVGNWQREIFGYFEHPITNAYTESLNNLIRVMNRLGRGYSFEALRAKILFAEGAYKHVNSRPKFERKTPAPALKNFEVGFYTPSPPPPAFSVMESQPEAEYMQKSIEREKSEKNYGVDISTLVRMIEAGEI
jgi:transposase